MQARLGERWAPPYELALEPQLDVAGGIERALSGMFGLPVEAAWRPVIERAAAPGG